VSAVRILIADDHELVRLGLVSILSGSHPEWHISGNAATGAAALELGRAIRPDVAILDLSMPDLNGLQISRRLVEEVPGIRIIILTMYAAAPILPQLRKAGVGAYLAKTEAPCLLVESVERILRGEPFFASPKALEPVPEETGYIPAQFVLTPRELDVLRLLARGKSNKELAAELDMGIRTAESHHANLLAKLRVESLGELVRIAVRDGV
jgi:DNA-binding NarL/FixJ family response regulator